MLSQAVNRTVSLSVNRLRRTAEMYLLTLTISVN